MYSTVFVAQHTCARLIRGPNVCQNPASNRQGVALGSRDRFGQSRIFYCTLVLASATRFLVRYSRILPDHTAPMVLCPRFRKDSGNATSTHLQASSATKTRPSPTPVTGSSTFLGSQVTIQKHSCSSLRLVNASIRTQRAPLSSFASSPRTVSHPTHGIPFHAEGFLPLLQCRRSAASRRPSVQCRVSITMYLHVKCTSST